MIGMRVRRWMRRAARGALALSALCLVAVVLAWWVPLPARLSETPSQIVEYRDGTIAHVFLSSDDKWRISVRLEEVDPAYVDALIRLEDKRFWWHPGVDPIAVARAAVLNVVRGRRVSGASTLTMQLVRVLEPRPRTMGSKVTEALRAVQLELRMSKEEILAAYLQHVPYGGNVEGVESAALSYFGHRAAALSPAEIATLLAVPQHPGRRAPSAQNVERLRQGRDDIAARLVSDGFLPRGEGETRLSAEEVLAQVKSADLPRSMRAFPREAAHVAYWLRRAHPDQPRVRTTLERGAQQVTEKAVAAAASEARHKGIHNAAAVVVDHRSGEVRALVGGFDFFGDDPAAQLPAFNVARSPGSTLKPFLYAGAIDRGLALPEQLVVDVPVTFGGYSPKNYDGEFSGLVTLEDSLSRSLNVPFVNLLNELGVERFLGDLRAMGVRSLVDAPGHYGLSAVVGGMELTPLELASLYVTLANGGRPRQVVWLESQEQSAPTLQVFSEGSAHLTRRALSLKDRPDFPARLRYTALPRGIHWKTGTSFGNRDAWAAGSDAEHSAVIWMGNLDNAGSGELVGADAAGPVLFDVLEAVADRRRVPHLESTPRELADVEVCAYSGHVPTAACQHKKVVLARRTAVPTKRCPYHLNVEVDRASGRALTPACRGDRAYDTKSYLVWPTSIRRWLKDQQRVTPTPPALAEGCEPGGRRIAPKIVSPPEGQIALLLRGVAAEDQEIPLEAEADVNAKLSWFVNGEFLGTAAAEERLWWTPKQGRHEILVSDETGRSVRRTIDVRERTY